MEMPSLNWEDVADNWFGGCCTSFGGASEKLVSNYINAYGRLEGTSLLDVTSISIETDCLKTNLSAQIACLTLSRDSVAHEEDIADVSIGKDQTSGKIELESSEELANITCIHSETNGVTRQADQSGTSHLENDVDHSEKSRNDFYVENLEKSDKEIDRSLVDPYHCCSASEYSGKDEGNPSPMPLENQNNQTLLETKRDYKLTKTISIGSSFIIKASNRLNDIEWVEFLCAQCSSPLGSYPSQCLLVPADGRVRLFKCYTSTELPVAGPHDVFR
jgi:hypothetical protein